MKKNYLESRSRGTSYMKYVNGRLTVLVAFCVETAFYNRLLKERQKGK
jgi:ribosomal protein S26